MRIKYYLRGLGTGIIVTFIILTVSNGIKADTEQNQTQQNPSEPTTSWLEALHSAGAETQPFSTDIQSEANTEEASTSYSEEETQTQAHQQTQEAQETQDAAKSTAPEDIQPVTDTHRDTQEITISFRSVNSSESASQLLEDAGLVSNWREFNAFLMNNGYDRKISSGTFTFSGGESFEELAQIITGGR